MQKKYDYLIVGAGLFGAVFAREATNAGKHCLVCEKRPHIGGNVYTEQVEGINVHKYGAHIFHTSNKAIWEYVNRYAEFNRYDFLEKDANGNWVWNDRFLFSCDTSAPLASNREAMWQETRMNLQTGAFGDPTSTETLILFWSKMEMLHYPGAGETKSFLEEKLEREREAAKAQAMMPKGVPPTMQGQPAQPVAAQGMPVM